MSLQYVQVGIHCLNIAATRNSKYGVSYLPYVTNDPEEEYLSCEAFFICVVSNISFIFKQ